MLILCQQYQFKLIYKRGKELIITDALSRAYVDSDLEETSEWDKLISSHVSLITAESKISDNVLQKIRSEMRKTHN